MRDDLKVRESSGNIFQDLGAREAEERLGDEYRVLIEHHEDGFYVAEVPALPGCISQGDTREEALANIREAIALYLKSLEEHHEVGLIEFGCSNRLRFIR
jgi:predicted RNase H-like HicB family nuclease